jgi:SAM-dependent methyltransferase
VAAPADITAAFQWLLGRPPAAEELDAAASIPPDQLRERLMASDAFAAGLPASAVRLREEHARIIPWDVSPDSVSALLAQVQAHWTQLGETRPHWSTAASPAFTPEQIDANQGEFQASGAADVAWLVALLSRHGWQPADLPRVLDFGCGIGRMTAPMAGIFASVSGCDISPSHLALARAACGRRVRFSLVSVPDFGMAEPFDLWFSTRTLQHNPAPISAMILRRAFALLAVGGVAVFQVPTARVGYDPAAATGETLPIHVLPQSAIFALAADAGCRPVEVVEDSIIWPPTLCRSNSFVFHKPRG